MVGKYHITIIGIHENSIIITTRERAQKKLFVRVGIAAILEEGKLQTFEGTGRARCR
jgi:hypothetical protein